MNISLSKFFALYMLASTACISANNAELIADLKLQLVTAHTLVKGFVYSKIRELNKPFTPRDVCRSTRRLMVRILRNDSAHDPRISGTSLEEDRLKRTVHCLYRALQEIEPIDEETFHTWYEIYPDALIDSTTSILLYLHDYLSSSPLWLSPEHLLEVCQEAYDYMQSTRTMEELV